MEPRGAFVEGDGKWNFKRFVSTSAKKVHKAMSKPIGLRNTVLMYRLMLKACYVTDWRGVRDSIDEESDTDSSVTDESDKEEAGPKQDSQECKTQEQADHQGESFFSSGFPSTLDEGMEHLEVEEDRTGLEDGICSSLNEGYDADLGASWNEDNLYDMELMECIPSNLLIDSDEEDDVTMNEECGEGTSSGNSQGTENQEQCQNEESVEDEPDRRSCEESESCSPQVCTTEEAEVEQNDSGVSIGLNFFEAADEEMGEGEESDEGDDEEDSTTSDESGSDSSDYYENLGPSVLEIERFLFPLVRAYRHMVLRYGYGGGRSK